jgi:hypothetical protein
MQLFLIGYILVSICEIFTVGGIPLDDDVRKVWISIYRKNRCQRLTQIGFHSCPPRPHNSDDMDSTPQRGRGIPITGRRHSNVNGSHRGFRASLIYRDGLYRSRHWVFMDWPFRWQPQSTKQKHRTLCPLPPHAPNLPLPLLCPRIHSSPTSTGRKETNE